jgi:gentisate 1,2-dioxygenase
LASQRARNHRRLIKSVAPCWKSTEHAATTDAVGFSMSDEPSMRFADHHRFEGAA